MGNKQRRLKADGERKRVGRKEDVWNCTVFIVGTMQPRINIIIMVRYKCQIYTNIVR